MNNINKKVYLDQKDNYAKNFGIAYRTSTIFYYKKTENFSTIINYMNYWPIKKSMEVAVIASLRDMQGNLLLREQVSFDKGQVVNYSPEIIEDSFEGSLEMEAIAAGNLGIPFAAMLVIYDAEVSVSMVHGYTRTYSTHEVEEGKTITFGEEAGLVVRDNHEVRSFLIGHNGIYEQEQQEITLWITNHKNITLESKFILSKLNKYETFKIYPRDHFDNIISFLDGDIGNCSINFELNGGFTRLVVGNETIDEKEFQVLHSNFNYGRHNPGYVDDEPGYFSFPYSEDHEKQFVHMDSFSAKGKYLLTSSGGEEYSFEPGQRVDIPMKSEVLKIERLDGNLPARVNIVFSSFLKDSKCKLGMESARGFYHSKRPPKYRLWMVAAIGKRFRSKLIIHSIIDHYGPVGDSELSITLYKENTFNTVTKVFKLDEITQFEKGIYVDEVFPEECNSSDNEIGQLWIQSSSYGGHQAFTTIEKENGSASIEHNY
jgi:hypothetical protein